MTSEPTAAYVWIWLPGAFEPVVSGRLDDDGGRISFTYARSYLNRDDAVPIYGPELPLRAGPQFAASGTRLPLCIDDAVPDAWGRRLVQYRRGALTTEFGELTYLLDSGPDRIGALAFEPSAAAYEPRGTDHPTLEDLAAAAAQVELGQPMKPTLVAALLHGTPIGGARPKALVRDGDRTLIAKFSSTTDTTPVMQAEYVAMELARRAGIDVAPVRSTATAGRHVLLLDDILDTGRTISKLVEHLKYKGTASVRTCVLLKKIGRQQIAFEPDYTGFSIPDKFVVGYGLDFNDLYRHLPFIAVLPDSAANGE